MIFNRMKLNQMGIWFGAVAGLNPSAHYVVIRVSIRNFFDILCRNFDYPRCWGAVGYNAFGKRPRNHHGFDLLTPRHVPFGDVFLVLLLWRSTRRGRWSFVFQKCCHFLWQRTQNNKQNGEDTMKKINLFNRNTNLPSYRRMPVSRGFNRGGGIPLFSGMTAVIFALFIATPSFATDPDPAVIDRQIVASKAYVDTKQDIIETGLVEYTDAEEQIDYDVPALVSYGTGTNNADGIQGNKIGILGINENMGGLNSYDFLDMWDDEESGYLDNFVPTVRAVSAMLGDIQWTALTWDGTKHPSAIDAYSVTFGTATNNWPSANRAQLVNGDTFANALALKQNILPAKWTSTTSSLQTGAKGGQTIELNTLGNIKRRYITAGGNEALTLKSGADNVILYVNGTKTVEEFQTSNFGGTGVGATAGQNYIKGALVSLELLKDVYDVLALPAGTAGNVVTYSGTAGTVSSRGVYNDPSSEYFDNPNINDNELITVNAAAAIVDYVDARTPEITCAGVEPGTNECWLWTIPTYTTTTRPLPRGDGNADV